jgi:hypothetical protein
MMKTAGDIFTLMIVCIIIYLFLSNGDTSVRLIAQGSSAITNMGKMLQGR